ncbi:oxidoreductase, short chain dehydrogenase/reductase family protein [Streptococcus cristatus ATCC 51100]|uniref:Oxidoreductase, short chain dehydrogenase/reductase family protein n=2 Tax=Streptococcus cristatus TaxID=45634 RepID=A0AAV3EDF2_STRCR|nr:3-oxoacyl-ACP reductase [Streptococcus cristatus]EFX52915.1 oxidoreductase, short chain dehydrogenase/reductase family protein [Streptococcus cristatus ATCC 51100]EGU66833.1 oxidoreductase, short chain dehydrogenase/reductase family protein [Streptococcus cristatus ATCC 51100]KJQ57537.1 3-ketoacyl-ACP reductase [Streptococcus cristatus]MCG7330169.1 3-oxoacyl-ACP reductase [Streptococcus cristatus]RSJ73113.1 Cyclopentanol dehydrogenase [Streptococcus cristatus]
MTKTVLVTGASSGIGRAQALTFLENGYRVYGVDKGENPGFLNELRFFKMDLTEDLTPLFTSLPEVDILCNTAGILDDYRPLHETSDEDWERIFALNLTATMKITRFYLQKMLEKKSGIIINMCSIASFLAGGGGAAYTASKHALAGLTKQIALDYADQNIQVFGLAPGAVKTAMTAADFEPGGVADWVAEETPIKRWLAPQEVADVSLFLASGKAAAMQGEIIKIDGGWSLK